MSSPYLSLDIGLRRTGVAVSESGRIAQPLRTITWNPPHDHTMVADVVALVREYEVQTLIIGIPYGDEESVTAQALKTAVIADHIETALSAADLHPEVIRINEYFSTQDAQVRFPGIEIDAAAAAVILQNYLEENGEAW